LNDERLNKVLLHLGNAVLAHHQGMQELMTHMGKSGEMELAQKLLATQEKAITALQMFAAEVEGNSQ